MNYQRPVWVEVDLSAFKANLRTIKSFLKSNVKYMAVVKANAYGHGLIPISEAAQEAGADWLGVALVEEALALRQAGIELPILLLSEPPVTAVSLIVDNQLATAVYSKEFTKALNHQAARQDTLACVHIKVDSGMHRVGLRPEKIADFYDWLSQLSNIKVEGIFTHFAMADQPDNPYTNLQLKSFLELKKHGWRIPLWHAANSAATLFFPESQLDLVRIGIAGYGLQPSTLAPAPLPLKSCLSLKAKVSYVSTLNPSEGTSYGLTYRANRRTKIAILPLGYADGYSRLLSNKSKVLIDGQRVKVIGNVCMDQLVIELPETVEAGVGSLVTLIGESGSAAVRAEDLANWLGTINYEVVCSIGSRVPRIYLQ